MVICGPGDHHIFLLGAGNCSSASVWALIAQEIRPDGVARRRIRQFLGTVMEEGRLVGLIYLGILITYTNFLGCRFSWNYIINSFIPRRYLRAMCLIRSYLKSDDYIKFD